VSRRRIVAAVAGALGALSILVTVTAFGSGGAAPLLPDLDPAKPGAITASQVGPAFLLSFGSSVYNIGDGPFELRGSRASVAEPEMTAEQIVYHDDGSTTSQPGVGTLRYVLGNHNHWHLLSFMVYELRRASDYALVGPDQKTGFCLLDSRNLDPTTLLPGEPPRKVYKDDCQRNKPTSLGVTEGISRGWGDHYKPTLEGQYIDITGIPDGQYMLVYRVNTSGALLETNYANNASSVLLSITWPNGQLSLPTVQVLRKCPDSERCGP
jgi:hypothetical protein